MMKGTINKTYPLKPFDTDLKIMVVKPVILSTSSSYILDERTKEMLMEALGLPVPSVNGPNWVQQTMTPEELYEYMEVRKWSDNEGHTLVPVDGARIEYYHAREDRIAVVTELIGETLWLNFVNEEDGSFKKGHASVLKLLLSEIDWNGFRIIENTNE